MTLSRMAALISTLLVGLLLAVGASAQPVQKEVSSINFTGQVMAVDGKAKTISVEGANGEKGVFIVDAKQTTIMSGNQKVGFSSLHKGEWIVINANERQQGTVASYIEVVEDPTGDADASPAEATAAGATVEVRHGKLTPAVTTIRAGQSVTFHNIDKMPKGHTVVASDGAFSSPALDEGQSWSHSFDVPGTYTVMIKEHPKATASIVVEAGE